MSEQQKAPDLQDAKDRTSGPKGWFDNFELTSTTRRKIALGMMAVAGFSFWMGGQAQQNEVARAHEVGRMAGEFETRWERVMPAEMDDRRMADSVSFMSNAWLEKGAVKPVRGASRWLEENVKNWEEIRSAGYNHERLQQMGAEDFEELLAGQSSFDLFLEMRDQLVKVGENTYTLPLFLSKIRYHTLREMEGFFDPDQGQNTVGQRDAFDRELLQEREQHLQELATSLNDMRAMLQFLLHANPMHQRDIGDQLTSKLESAIDQLDELATRVERNRAIILNQIEAQKQMDQERREAGNRTR